MPSLEQMMGVNPALREALRSRDRVANLVCAALASRTRTDARLLARWELHCADVDRQVTVACKKLGVDL